MLYRFCLGTTAGLCDARTWEETGLQTGECFVIFIHRQVNNLLHHCSSGSTPDVLCLYTFFNQCMRCLVIADIHQAVKLAVCR